MEKPTIVPDTPGLALAPPGEPPPEPVALNERQIEIPPAIARRLTYDLGFALGLATGAGHLRYMPILLEALVLGRRPGDDLSTTANLMGMSEPGLRGFLEGAREKQHWLFEVKPDMPAPL